VEEHRIIELLTSIRRKLTRTLIPLVEAEGLSATESLALWKIKRNQPCRAMLVAEEFGLPPSTVTGVLERLVEKKLLQRVPDPADRRAVLMRTTADTDALLERLTAAVDARVAAVLRCLPPGIQARLLRDLQAFLECLERGQEEAVRA
jgi:MarR family transcriptional regulator for hemolysin